MLVKLGKFKKNLRESLTDVLAKNQKMRESVDMMKKEDHGHGKQEYEGDPDEDLEDDCDSDGFEIEVEEHVDIYVDDQGDQAPVDGDEGVEVEEEGVSDMQPQVQEDDEKKSSWVEKNKENFKKRYGDRGEQMLNKQANRMFKSKKKEESLDMTEATPPGFEKVVKALKHEKGVDNPWAVAWSMKDKGEKPKK